MGRFNKEVEDFVSAFKAGNDIGYRMRYFQLQQRQQQLRERQMEFRERQFEQRQQRGTGGGGMPADTQELIEQGRGKRFGPGSENQTTPPANKQATVQPNKAEIPDATPTAKSPSGGGSDGATPASSGGSSGGGGGDKRASITDRYPGSYQTAALETGTTNDASPIRTAVSPRPAGGGVGGASPTSFGSNSVVMYRALTDLGVKPQVAAGAVGSMMGESGRHLNPAAYNPNDRGKPSGGALQWRGDRLSGLYQFAGTRDIKQIPIETQAKWMQRELQGSERGALESLLKGTTVADGARAWTYNFERPYDKPGETARRTPMGEQFWSTIESGSIPATTSGSRNQDAGNSRMQTAAVDTGTKTDASPAVPAATTPATGATPATGGSPTTPVSPPTSPQPAAVPASDAPLPPKRPDDLTPEFPKTAPSADPPMPPQRPEMGPPMPENLKPAVETAQPTAEPTAEAAPQQDGWSFLDDIGQGIDDFFSDLNVPADWDIGSGDASWGTAADMGGDFGGIGGALGGIGDAIGGLFSAFNRGGMVR